MAGELSKAKRNKAMARAVTVLPPGTQVRGFVVGRAQARWSTSAISILAGCGALVIIGLLMGVVLYPGFVVILFFSHVYRPPRGIAIADQGVASFTRSVVSGEFKDVIGYESLGALNGVLTNSSSRLQIGDDVISLSGREMRQVQQLAPSVVAPVHPMSPTPTTTTAFG
jgi:hypothetical protein